MTFHNQPKGHDMPDFVIKYKWYIIGGVVALAIITTLWNGGI